MTNIKKILKKADSLKPVPAIVNKILTLANDPESGLDYLVHLVKHEPSITANLLRTCNSAAMGLSVKIDSVQQAVAMLGTQEVVELVLSQNLSNNLLRAQKGYRLAKNDLWKQSVATAMVARTLAERRDLFNLPAIYTAALLKDIGKVILQEFVDHELDKIDDLVKNEGLSFLEAEEVCLGMNHAALGAIITKRWHFSDHMVYMIEHHHLDKPEARNDPATATIYLADMVAMMVGTCIGVDRLAYHVYEDIFDDFFLAKDEIKAMMMTYEGFISGAGQLFIY
jgi:putative nucleotidyltransferase with HDIG domain